jgi:N-acyl amino acid synthase of PEP-CTERM/exosortase system
MTASAQAPFERTTRHLDARVIDDAPALLEASYRLRFQVYCHERGFLDAADYPAGAEFDEFDAHAVHIGAVDGSGQLAGTARLIRYSDLGLPLFRHCSIFPEHAETCRQPAVLEVSRLSVSRHYARRDTDGAYGVNEREAAGRVVVRNKRRRVDGEVFLAVTKALYQASKRLGATHWLAATESSLHRILLRFGLPFRQVGPESDYFGMVAPYLMEIAELDEVIASGRVAVLGEFADGLEPVLSPLSGGSPGVGRHAGSPRLVA